MRSEASEGRFRTMVCRNTAAIRNGWARPLVTPRGWLPIARESSHRAVAEAVAAHDAKCLPIIRRMRAEGADWRRIAKALDLEVEPPGRRAGYSYGPWQPTAVRRIARRNGIEQPTGDDATTVYDRVRMGQDREQSMPRTAWFRFPLRLPRIVRSASYGRSGSAGGVWRESLPVARPDRRTGIRRDLHDAALRHPHHFSPQGQQKGDTGT